MANLTVSKTVHSGSNPGIPANQWRVRIMVLQRSRKPPGIKPVRVRLSYPPPIFKPGGVGEW
jgi:hypothetical protein